MQPQYPYQPQQPPSRRRLSGGKLVLVIVLSLAGLGVLCVGGFAGVLWFVLDKASDAPRAATHAFVDDLAAQNTDGAYAKLCDSVRSRYTREQFGAYVAEQPPVGDVKISGFSVQNGTASITTSLTLKDGGSRPHVFELVEGNDGWKVCGDPY